MIKEKPLDATRLTHSITVSATYGSLEPIIDWCKKFCVSQWGWQVVETAGSTPGEYRFYFEDRDDYINFIMWQK